MTSPTGDGLPGVGVLRRTEVELFSVGGHDGYLREVNRAFAALLGRRTDEVNGHSVLEFVHPEDLGQVVAGISALERGKPEVLLESRFRHVDGPVVHLQWVARSVPETDSWWAAGRDTTAFHSLLTRHNDLRVGLELALGQASAALWDLDITTGVFTFEPQAAGLLGVGVGQLPVTLAELTAMADPDDAGALAAAVARLTASGAAEVDVRVGADTMARYLSLRGRVLSRDRRSRPVRAVGVLLDVTADRAMQEQMLRMALSDPLTGIPNRRAFDQALRTEWRRCARAGEPLSVLMIDVDNFKRFNDTFGHLIGDAALIIIARALTDGLLRAGDVLARYGGEEFAAVLPGVAADGAAVVAHRLVEAVRTVNIRQAAGWQATVSVGAATHLPDGAPSSSTALLASADAALYAAKAAGKNRAFPSMRL